MPDRRCHSSNRRFLFCITVMALAMGSSVFGQTAVRDLSGFQGLNQTFTVSISVTPPPGTIAFGVEDSPPAGWTDVGNIDNGGLWDAINGKVKWGPYFSDQPITLNYDLTLTESPGNQSCFSGVVSFDGNNQSVLGDVCLPRAIPAVSDWGVFCLVILLGISGSVLIRARSPSIPR